MFGSFSRNGDVDHLYIPRHIGGRGLVSAHYVIKHEKISYVRNSNDGEFGGSYIYCLNMIESADDFKHNSDCREHYVTGSVKRSLTAFPIACT